MEFSSFPHPQKFSMYKLFWLFGKHVIQCPTNGLDIAVGILWAIFSPLFTVHEFHYIL